MAQVTLTHQLINYNSIDYMQKSILNVWLHRYPDVVLQYEPLLLCPVFILVSADAHKVVYVQISN